jgi:hypothetical protein
VGLPECKQGPLRVDLAGFGENFSESSESADATAKHTSAALHGVVLQLLSFDLCDCLSLGG